MGNDIARASRWDALHPTEVKGTVGMGMTREWPWPQCSEEFSKWDSNQTGARLLILPPSSFGQPWSLLSIHFAAQTACAAPSAARLGFFFFV